MLVVEHVEERDPEAAGTFDQLSCQRAAQRRLGKLWHERVQRQLGQRECVWPEVVACLGVRVLQVARARERGAQRAARARHLVARAIAEAAHSCGSVSSTSTARKRLFASNLPRSTLGKASPRGWSEKGRRRDVVQIGHLTRWDRRSRSAIAKATWSSSARIDGHERSHAPSAIASHPTLAKNSSSFQSS